MRIEASKQKLFSGFKMVGRWSKKVS
ncbi:hypothetical protein Gotur_025673 [Gossypium turneri]